MSSIRKDGSHTSLGVYLSHNGSNLLYQIDRKDSPEEVLVLVAFPQQRTSTDMLAQEPGSHAGIQPVEDHFAVQEVQHLNVREFGDLRKCWARNGFGDAGIVI
jgi:hypothetical protein